MRSGGQSLQLFIFGLGYSHGAPALKFRVVSAVFLHGLSAFYRARSEAPSAMGIPKGLAPWQVGVAGGSQLPTCKYKPLTGNKIPPIDFFIAFTPFALLIDFSIRSKMDLYPVKKANGLYYAILYESYLFLFLMVNIYSLSIYVRFQ